MGHCIQFSKIAYLRINRAKGIATIVSLLVSVLYNGGDITGGRFTILLPNFKLE